MLENTHKRSGEDKHQPSREHTLNEMLEHQESYIKEYKRPGNYITINISLKNIKTSSA